MLLLIQIGRYQTVDACASCLIEHNNKFGHMSCVECDLHMCSYRDVGVVYQISEPSDSEKG